MKYEDYLEKFKQDFTINELESINAQEAQRLIDIFNHGFSAGADWAINETI